MERFFGVAFTDLDSVRKLAKDPEETLIQALNVWMSSLMMCEFFHADVHAGNLLVLEGGRVGFIDFGIVGRIQKKTWTAMNSLLLAMNGRDYKLAAESIIGIGAADENANKERFAKELKDLFDCLTSLRKTSRRQRSLSRKAGFRKSCCRWQKSEKETASSSRVNLPFSLSSSSTLTATSASWLQN